MKNPLLTQEGILRHVGKGHGHGSGPDYKPWLEVRHVPSLGKSSREMGWKTGRIHTLLSQLELRYFYHLEWADDIVDIREQFPLFPQADTAQLCEQLGIKPPRQPGAGVDMVITTDFLVRTNDGKDHARAVKYAKDLEDGRTVEKLEIERLYWHGRGVDWKIVTENEISDAFAKNVEWLHPKRDIKSLELAGEGEILCVRETIEEPLLGGIHSLTSATKNCDDLLGYRAGTSLSIARHLLANKVWMTDMQHRIEPMKPTAIQIHEPGNQQIIRMA